MTHANSKQQRWEQARVGLEHLLGSRFGAAALAVRPWLRLTSHAPTHRLRIFALRSAGATIGANVRFDPGITVLSPWRLRIGSHCNIARGARLDARGRLTIGNNVNVSEDVAIWTAEHDLQSATFEMTREPVVIEDDVWVAFRSIILPGTTLGRGCVVAAGSVVTRSVPACTIVAGVPAKPIGTRNQDLRYQLGRAFHGGG